jgi:hypothetical protein
MVDMFASWDLIRKERKGLRVNETDQPLLYYAVTVCLHYLSDVLFHDLVLGILKGRKFLVFVDICVYSETDMANRACLRVSNAMKLSTYEA